MGRNASGSYTLPLAAVITGTTIDSSWANTTLTDIEGEMTDSLSREGKGGMLAPFKATDGTVGAPGITFSDDTDTGFYRGGANDLRIGIAGAEIAKFESNLITVMQEFSIPDGLAAAPAIRFTSDVDTGIYSAGVAEINFSIAGAEAASIDANGFNVPSRILAADGTAAEPAFSFTADDNIGFYRVSNNTVGLSSAGGLSFSMRADGIVLQNNTTGIRSYNSTGTVVRDLLMIDNTDVVKLGNTSGPLEISSSNDVDGAVVSMNGERVASYERKNDWVGQYTGQQTLTAAASTTIDANLSNAFYVNLNTNITTLTLSNMSDGQSITLLVRQDSTNNITFPGGWYWSGTATAPTITPTAGRYDLFTVTRLGGINVATFAQDFQT